MTAPRVLITNDDGIAAPGIHALARAVVAAGYETVVAAPLRESSGMSAAMTATERDGRVVLEARTLPRLEGTAAYGVAGSPGFVALIASRGAFGDPPDVVLSGINRGANAGHAILHSGTVGAALTAAANDARALAVSLDVLTAAQATASSGGAAIASIDDVEDAKRNWDTAAAYTVELIPALLSSSPGTVFNLNVPDAPLDEVRGLRRATMARFGQVQITLAEVGHGYVRTALEESAGRLDPTTDLGCLAAGFASITILQGVTESAEIVDIPLTIHRPADASKTRA